MRHLHVTVLAVLAATPLLSGCEEGDQFIQVFNDQVGRRIGLKLQSMNKQTPAQAAATPSPTPTESARPDHRQVNAEFIREMFKVVLQREVANEEEFARYMNVMDQGGHYEGIYNGIVYSGEYKQREKGVAPVRAVKLYAELMMQIALDQKFDPLKIEKPDEHDALNKDSAAPPQPTDLDRETLKAEFERNAITMPLYTLKRRLGEEILKTIELKREYKEKFATWYGHFTVFLNKKGVDFGYPQRNKTSEYYHYKWALDADEDRLKWECINRLHALMNAQAK